MGSPGAEAEGKVMHAAFRIGNTNGVSRPCKDWTGLIPGTSQAVE